MKFKNYIEAQSGIKDSANSSGTLDQVLTSTETGIAWVEPSTISAEAATLVVIECKNTSGATITKGTPVYQTGTVGATDVIEIAPADALISSGSQPAIGLLQTTLNDNGFGKVVITGEFLNFTTDPIDGVTPTAGDKIFLKSGGGLTLTKPTGAENGIQNLGLIGKVSGGNAGSITVSSIMRTNDVPNLPTGKIWVGDGNTIVSDTVFLDEPNGRMGIGTTSPNAKLDVDGAGNFSGGTVVSGIDTSTDVGVAISKGDYLYSNDGNYLRRLIGQQSGGSIDIGQQGTGLISNINFFPGTSGNIDFFGSGSIDMRVASTGNVGIGTTSNSADETNNGIPKLQVTTATALLGEFPLAARFTTASDAGDNSGVSVLINSGNDRGLMISAGRAVGNKSRATLNLVSFDGTELVDGLSLYMPNTGSTGATTGTNVGIGTTSPGAKLDIIGSSLGIRVKKADLSDVLRVYTQGSGTFMDGGNVHISDDLKIGATLLSNQENTNIDAATSPELVAQVSITDYTAAFFDFVVKKGTNVRSGTVYACHDGTNVEFTETSTNDLGDTSDVTLSVDISGGNMRLLATVTSDDWSVKSLIRAI